MVACEQPAQSLDITEDNRHLVMAAGQRRVNLLDTHVDSIDMAGVIARMEEFIRSGAPHQVVTVNLDFLRLARLDHSFRELINTSSLVIADGMPLVWGSRLQGSPLPGRVAGVDVVRECARQSALRGHRIYFLGAAPGVADRAADVLRAQFPGTRIVGTHSPASLEGAEEAMALAHISATAPDILFVALGAPLQDQWIRKHLTLLGVPVCMGIGGALDMISGQVSRAPGWMQHSGLEWFYRFSQEPGRLWKRYFVHDLPIFLRVLGWALDSANATTALSQLSPELDLDLVTDASRPTPARA